MTKKEKISIVCACAAVLLSGAIIFNSMQHPKHPAKTQAKAQSQPAKKQAKAPYSKNHVSRLLESVYDTFQIPRDGIIHIGAHYAEELRIYDHNKIPNILWIEADPAAEEKLRAATQHSPGSKVAIFAATDTNGTIELHTTSNRGLSSSVLKLKNHVYMSPDVLPEKTVTVPQQRLDDYLSSNADLQNIKYNVVVIDVQGAELIALKGAVKQLQNIDAIIAETNYDELYAGGVYIHDLDKFLSEQGFVRVDSISVNRSYGDALYVKNNFCKCATASAAA